MASNYIPISETILTVGNANQVDLTSISQSYRHLVLRMSIRSSNASGKSSIYLKFNNNSYNIWGGYIYGEDSTIGGGSQQSTAAGMSLGGTLFVPALTATSDTFSFTEVTIPYYANPSRRKTVGTLNGSPNKAGTGQGVSFGGGTINSTAAISQINIYLNSGNFVAGSSFRLYGLSV